MYEGRTVAYLRTEVRKYFRTFVLSKYFRTKVRKYLSSRADCTRTCANMRGPRAFCIISAPVLSRKIPVYYLYELSSPTEETAVPGVRCAHHRARNARREIGFLKGN